MVNKPMVSVHWNEHLVDINTIFYMFSSHQRRSVSDVITRLSSLVDITVIKSKTLETWRFLSRRLVVSMQIGPTSSVRVAHLIET